MKVKMTFVKNPWTPKSWPSKVYPPSSCKKIKPFLGTDFKSFELPVCLKNDYLELRSSKNIGKKFSYRSALMNEFSFLNHGSCSDDFVQIGINYHSDEVSVRAAPHIIELLWNSNNVSFFKAHVFNLLHKNTCELIFWYVPDARQLTENFQKSCKILWRNVRNSFYNTR